MGPLIARKLVSTMVLRMEHLMDFEMVVMRDSLMLKVTETTTD